MKLRSNWVLYVTASVVGLYFLIRGLIEAQLFLAPLTTAVILSLVMLPVAGKMEKNGMRRSLSSFLSTFFLFFVTVAFMALVSLQVKSLVADWPEIEQTMTPKLQQVETFLMENTPLTEKHLSKVKEIPQQWLGVAGENEAGGGATAFLSKTVSFFGNYLLTFIYVFFLMNYRSHFKKFLLSFFPKENRGKRESILDESVQVAPRYLAGKILLIAILAVLYAVGLGISGVDNFIIISFLAATLSLIPYIGNIIGFAITMVVGYLTTGETGILIGIILTFSIAQFVESYILEPYIVGDKVDLHPFFVILVVVIGNLMWGVIGMILFIPMLAILSVICMHIPQLKPFGKLLGAGKDEK